MEPIRCFTCLKVLGSFWETYNEDLKNGLTPTESFKKLRVQRSCCKTVMLSNSTVKIKILPSSELEIH
jgi:DNA-directed RNA polymerase subunit N (RpoN/RPB10)